MCGDVELHTIMLGAHMSPATANYGAHLNAPSIYGPQHISMLTEGYVRCTCAYASADCNEAMLGHA